MKEYAMRCGDLVLLTRQDVAGWSWVLDGPDAKNAASAKDENAAKNACISVAKARFRRRGMPIPVNLIQPQWTSGARAENGPV
jgi:hypothetical protein